jgi:hypothetical protein
MAPFATNSVSPAAGGRPKDTSDNLAAEIQKKLKAGYPARNTIFEDTQTAVLYQDRAEFGEFPLAEPVAVAALLSRFFSHDESDEREFQRAMEKFKSRIPDLSQSLRDLIKPRARAPEIVLRSHGNRRAK